VRVVCARISNAKEAGLFLVFANAAPENGHKGITGVCLWCCSVLQCVDVCCNENGHKGIAGVSLCDTLYIYIYVYI